MQAPDDPIEVVIRGFVNFLFDYLEENLKWQPFKGTILKVAR